MKYTIKEIKNFLKDEKIQENKLNLFKNIGLILLSDKNLSFDLIENLINEVNQNSLNKKEVSLYILFNGQDFYKNEKYFLKLIRALEENNYEFYTINIPFCYLQDYPNKSLEFLEFSYNGFIHTEELQDHTYFEDCKFCKIKNLCPGAKKIFDEQVFSVFKNYFEYILSLPEKHINLKIFKSNKIEEIAKKVNELTFRKEKYIINENSFSYNFLKELNLELFEKIYLLKSSENNIFENSLENFSEKIQVVKFDKFVYKSIFIEKSTKLVRMPLEFEICDHIIYLIDENYLNSFKSFTNDQLDDNELLELMLSNIHKIKYYILKKENNYYFFNSILYLIYFFKIPLPYLDEILKKLNVIIEN